MADPTKLPFFGKDSKLVLLYGGAKVPGIEGQVTQWSVKEVANRTRTGIAGRTRKRVDKTVDGYDADLSIEFSDLTAVNYLKSIDDDREAGIAKELSVGLEFAERDAGVEGVLLSTCTAMWTADAGDMSGHVTGKITVEAEDYSGFAL